jgi:hypothetical protein
MFALVILGMCNGPDDVGPTKVTERTTVYNVPGGVGRDHIRIKICVTGASICETYLPDNVKGCDVGDPWPGCQD